MDVALNNSEIIIYGCGSDGRKIYWLLQRMGVETSYFCDTYNCEKIVEGLRVLSPEELKYSHRDAMIVVGSRKYKRDILAKIREMDWPTKKVLSDTDEMFLQYNLYMQKEYSEYTLEQRREFVEDMFQKVMHRSLNLDAPRTFCEKIQWIKIYGCTPLMTRLADKYLVRNYVKEIVGAISCSANRCV